MKKILMFIDTIGYNGGAEKQFAGLASMLVEKGYNVIVVAYYPERGFFDFLQSKGVKVEIHNFGNGKLSKIIKAYNVFRKIKPDVVISYKNGPNVIACIVRLLGQKFRLIVSDRNTMQSTKKSVDLQYRLYQKANYIVPNSNSQARFINKYYDFLKKKIRVITNFTDTSVFKPLVNKKYNSIREIVVCGRITEQKNVLNFLQSVALLKNRIDLQFIIKWYGAVKDDNYYQNCLSSINMLGIGDVFSFQKPRKDIDVILRNADIFVLPSIYEGFPNVLCEAMSSGIPVIASNVCDNPDIISDGIDGFLFDPNNVDDMASKIEQLIKLQNEELSNIGIRARKTILRLCGREAFISKYCNII